MRWLYNYRGNDDASIHQSDWITPVFVRIKEKKIRFLSPYSETELWKRQEILSVVKYEPLH
jgi:integrase/recombinase XerD